MLFLCHYYRDGMHQGLSSKTLYKLSKLLKNQKALIKRNFGLIFKVERKKESGILVI